MTDKKNDAAAAKEQDKARLRQEATVLQGFMVATQQKVEDLRSTFGTSSQDLNLSEQEKRILNNIHNAGMMEGIIAGIASFVFLRRFPKYLNRMAARRVARQHQQQQRPGGGGSGYTLDHPGKASSPFQKSSAEQAFQEANAKFNNYKPGILWRSFSLSMDVTLSFLVAASCSYYFMDARKIKKSVTELPLMEGRSAISEHFCPVLIQEYHRQWKLSPTVKSHSPDNSSFESVEGMKNHGVLGNLSNKTNKEPLKPFDRKEVLKNPQQLELLKAYVEFTQNCMKRKSLERRIRQERGLDPSEQVEIPPPGVTASENWSSNDSVDDFDQQNDDFGEETQLSGDDGNWKKEDMSDFVSDQEDSSRE